MKKTTLILLLALGALLALALGLALREFVGDTILMPILFIAWLAQLVFSSIPGWLWWAWFVIIAVVLAQRSLKVRVRDTEGPNESRVPVAGPVHIWTERLRAAHHRNDYFRWLLARNLADVSTELAEVLTRRYTAYRERHGEARSDREDDLTALHAPPEVASYLQTGLAAAPSAPVRRLARITHPWRPKQELTPLDLDPEKVVTFLEGQLEKKHDD